MLITLMWFSFLSFFSGKKGSEAGIDYSKDRHQVKQTCMLSIWIMVSKAEKKKVPDFKHRWPIQHFMTRGTQFFLLENGIDNIKYLVKGYLDVELHKLYLWYWYLIIAFPIGITIKTLAIWHTFDHFNFLCDCREW